MLDTLSSIGILVAFYYSLTGIACVVYYRKHVVSSVRGFLMVGVGPLVGSIGLAFMLVVGIRSVSDPADSASGSSWLGLAPPLAIAALVILIGLLVLLVQMLKSPRFFRNDRERANHAQSPFLLGHDIVISPGGALIDCNATVHEVLGRVADHASELQGHEPVVLVFGIHPSGLSGEEMGAARESLIEDGHLVFTETERQLRTLGVRDPIRLFEEADARNSVVAAQERTCPSITV
jgi:hypothetical protein